MYLALPSCPQSGHSSLIRNTLRSILPSIISKTIMARDGKCSVHRNPSLAISVSALGLPIVRETYIRGSLIPQAINRLGEVANALQARLISFIQTNPELLFQNVGIRCISSKHNISKSLEEKMI